MAALPAMRSLLTLSAQFQSNRLRAIPPEIGRLTALQILLVAYNNLTVLPREMGQLRALDILAVSWIGDAKPHCLTAAAVEQQRADVAAVRALRAAGASRASGASSNLLRRL